METLSEILEQTINDRLQDPVFLVIFGTTCGLFGILFGLSMARHWVAKRSRMEVSDVVTDIAKLAGDIASRAICESGMMRSENQPRDLLLLLSFQERRFLSEMERHEPYLSVRQRKQLLDFHFHLQNFKNAVQQNMWADERFWYEYQDLIHACRRATKRLKAVRYARRNSIKKLISEYPELQSKHFEAQTSDAGPWSSAPA